MARSESGSLHKTDTQEVESLLAAMIRVQTDSGAGTSSAATAPEAMTREDLLKTELRFRALIEQLPAITFAASLEEGRHELYVSPQIETLLGFSQQEWLENPHLWFSQLHPDDRPRWQDEFARTIMSGSPFRSEYRLVTRDGREVWVRGEAQVIRDAAGRPLCLQGIVFDITEQKRAEAVLRKSREDLELEVLRRIAELRAVNRSLLQEVGERQRAERVARDREARLRAIVETAVDGIILIDQFGCVESFNLAAERIFGYPWREVVGQNVAMLMSEPYHEENDDLLGSYRGSGWSRLVGMGRDVVGIRKDGTRFPMELAISETPTPEGLKFTGMVRDVTDRKQAEASLIEAKLAAETASQLKGQFLANMSHEIRTPMNGILGMTELALDTRLDPVQRDCLETVKSSAESLLLLIDDILDFSKIEAGKLDLDPISFVLRDLLDEATKPLSLRIREKGLHFACEVDDDVPEVLVGDPGRLRQVVLNLISNAVKFTDQGEVVVKVQTLREAETITPKLLFSVRDTGIGIPDDKQHVIFDSFTQADGSTSRKFGGTGLGLAICRKLVEMMGGAICLSSTPGHGTTFYFTVVMPESSVSIAELTPLPRPSPVVRRDAPQVPPVRSLRILLAEDNKVNQKLAMAVLQKEGHRVQVAGDGEAVLCMIESSRFDLVLMDVQMPVLDGLAATRAIRDRERSTGQHIPIIALTANAMKGDREDCLAAGFDEYVTKPIRWPRLREAVDLVLAQTTPGAAAEPSALPAFSRMEVLELLGGDVGLFDEVALMFLEECPKLRANLVEAVACGDPIGLHRAAHSIKGVVANIAAHEATEAAIFLERIGRSGNLADAPDALASLEAQLDRLERDIREMLSVQPVSL